MSRCKRPATAPKRWMPVDFTLGETVEIIPLKVDGVISAIYSEHIGYVQYKVRWVAGQALQECYFKPHDLIRVVIEVKHGTPN